MGKCALIVDDSRTSRVVLERILATHDLIVDHADSAESALEYLADHRPDVIFMDHLMPGMDGFQAVAAIKRNPQTATIPIMMYTSQKGDVYVGQARALGAVGVLPKEVEPVAVSKVLESLHIVGTAPAPPPIDAKPREEAVSVELPILESVDQDLRHLLEDLFDQQQVILKRDLQNSSEAIAARVADRIKAAEPEEPEAEIDERRPGWLSARFWVIAALVGIITVLSFSYLQLNERWQDAVDENANLRDAIDRQAAQSAGTEDTLLRQIDDYRSTMNASQAAMLDAIEWGINRSGRYSFGEPPLGDVRVGDFEALTNHLLAIGFTGQVVVETHVGNHCLSFASEGYRLADPQSMAERCDARGFSMDEALELSRRQSVAMANFINASETRTGGAVRFSILGRGAANPIVEYPVSVTAVTAGEWNAIADANHRIEIRLLPDSTAQ